MVSFQHKHKIRNRKHASTDRKQHRTAEDNIGMLWNGSIAFKWMNGYWYLVSIICTVNEMVFLLTSIPLGYVHCTVQWIEDPCSAWNGKNNASLEVGKLWIYGSCSAWPIINWPWFAILLMDGPWSTPCIVNVCIVLVHILVFLSVLLCADGNYFYEGNFISHYFLMNGSYCRSHYVYEWNFIG